MAFRADFLHIKRTHNDNGEHTTAMVAYSESSRRDLSIDASVGQNVLHIPNPYRTTSHGGNGENSSRSFDRRIARCLLYTLSSLSIKSAIINNINRKIVREGALYCALYGITLRLVYNTRTLRHTQN